MKKLFALLLCLAALTGCAESESSTASSGQSAGTSQVQSAAESQPPQPTAEELAQARIDQILSSLTLEEKVGQLFFVRCPASGAAEDVTAFHLGGLLLFGRDYQEETGAYLTKEAFTAKLQSYQDAAAADTGIPLLIGSDEEGGTVTRASRNPNFFAAPFPSPQAVEAGASGHGDPFAEDAYEKNSALKALGINVNLAPVADVSTDPADFIYDRTIGKDAAGTADYVERVVSAMADTGIGSVLKHFPGYGSNADTHTGIAVDQRPMEQFVSSDFLPFSAGIAAGGGTTAVLVSHNIMTAVDESRPASLSPAVYDLLRQELHFDGVAMTDDLAMEAVAAYSADGTVAAMALSAGCDLVITTDYATQIPRTVEAVEAGTLSLQRVEEACRRVLRWKQALGLLPAQ